MFWIVMLSGSMVAGFAGLAFESPHNWQANHVAEVFLVCLVVGFFGLGTLLAGLQHVFNGPKIARMIGWEPGSGFQLELGWAEVGIGFSGLLALFFVGSYLIAPVVVGSALYLGAAGVHAKEMRRGNNHEGNAGAVFYVDIIAPVLALILLAVAQPWH